MRKKESHTKTNYAGPDILLASAWCTPATMSSLAAPSATREMASDSPKTVQLVVKATGFREDKARERADFFKSDLEDVSDDLHEATAARNDILAAHEVGYLTALVNADDVTRLRLGHRLSSARSKGG